MFSHSVEASSVCGAGHARQSLRGGLFFPFLHFLYFFYFL